LIIKHILIVVKHFGRITMNNRTKGILMLALSAALWSLGGLLIKSINWNPLAIAGMRCGIASIILLAVIKKPKLNWSKGQVGAALAYTATVMLFVSANKMTTAANSILLQYTSPIYVALFGAWLLKEKTRWFDWVTILLVMGGMAFFFLDNLSLDGGIGNVLAAISGLTFGLFIVLMRLQKDGSPIESVFLGNIITFVICLPFMFQPGPDTNGWIALVLLAVFQFAIPYIIYANAVKFVTAIEAVIIMVIEPLLNPVWVFLVIGESPGLWALVGGIIVVTSVLSRSILTGILEAKEKKDIPVVS
jgi:drug/metabolite transporter (DMT)-like permease